MRILIADDHALFRRGLSLLLRQLYPDAELAEATDIAGALALGERLAQCDVVLLDLTMPGMEGFAGVERLRAAAPAARIVMLSASADLDSIRKAMAAGARGYVLKSGSDETLRHALALVMAGEVYVPPVVLAELDRPQGGAELPADSPLRSLTERQRPTLLLLVQGLSNKEIARQLGLLESTVKAHLKVILKKLGAGNRTQAALLATQMGLGRTR
jgi:two-component system nitrate/nitrite response regulator NarL